MIAVQEHLAARSAKILLLAAKHIKLTYELSPLKLQSAAENTVPNDLNSVAGAYKRPAKHAKKTRQCRNASATSSTARFRLSPRNRMTSKVAVNL